MIQHAQSSEPRQQIIIAETLLAARAAHHVFETVGSKATARAYFTALQNELQKKAVRFETAPLPGTFSHQFRDAVAPHFLKCYNGVAVFICTAPHGQNLIAALSDFADQHSIVSALLIRFESGGVTIEPINQPDFFIGRSL